MQLGPLLAVVALIVFLVVYVSDVLLCGALVGVLGEAPARAAVCCLRVHTALSSASAVCCVVVVAVFVALVFVLSQLLGFGQMSSWSCAPLFCLCIAVPRQLCMLRR